MRHVTTPLTAALLLAGLVLTGCTTAPAEEPAPAPSETSAASIEETSEPLVAETSSGADYETQDAQFLGELEAAYSRRAGSFETQIPNATDAQLLDAARRACEQIPSVGGDTTLVHVIDGETANGLGIYEDSAIIAAVAKPIYCP